MWDELVCTHSTYGYTVRRHNFHETVIGSSQRHPPAIMEAHGANIVYLSVPISTENKANRRTGRCGHDCSGLQTIRSACIVHLNARAGTTGPESRAPNRFPTQAWGLEQAPPGRGVWNDQGYVPLWFFGTRLLCG